MDIKLTLSLDSHVIQSAKEYARKQNTSLSNLVEQLLTAVTAGKNDDLPEISPLVGSLSGVISTDSLGAEYGDYLAAKYK